MEDFFGTINFGRVRGFFIKDSSFMLAEGVATLLAQIACHNNSLPQGAPSSPVISNLVGNILDARLTHLAKRARCTYTRYADDLTFSTNLKEFPPEVSIKGVDGVWKVGRELEREITRSGFSVNARKTRMSLRQSRQSVTGLVVNEKPNVARDYYRKVRAMCDSVFRTGRYFRSKEDEPTSNLESLHGMLSHVYYVKSRRDRRFEVNKRAKNSGEFIEPSGPVDLFRRFLFYRYFVAPTAPLVVTEGVSDIVYLKCAVRALGDDFPQLAESSGEGKVKRLVRFLMPSGVTRDILDLGHGSSGQNKLVNRYRASLIRYASRPMDHPVIVLCDNDGGPKELFKSAKKKCDCDVSVSTTHPFYYLGDNLYLVKVPEDVGVEGEIEHLFDSEWLSTLVDGKSLNLKKEHGDHSSYGKVVFAERVVSPNASEIDFSAFGPLLTRVSQCVSHYEKLKEGGGPDSRMISA